MRVALLLISLGQSGAHHFPSKVDQARKLVGRCRREAQAGTANLERRVSDPLEQFRFYVGYWEACIADASAPFYVCALLASQLPVLPEPVGVEVRVHFRALSAWLTSVLERGARHGHLQLTSNPRAEAEAFMATVHGAVLSAPRSWRSEDIRRRDRPAPGATRFSLAFVTEGARAIGAAMIDMQAQ